MAKYEISNSCWSVAISNDEIKKVDIVWLEGKTMKQWYANQTDKPDYLINASLWDNNGAIGTIYKNGKLIRNEGTGFGFGVKNDNKFGFSEPWIDNLKNYITGYPALIRNGEKTVDSVDNYVMMSKNKRSVIASAGNNLYLIATNEMTIAQLKHFCFNKGFFNAINLDGGGSSLLMVNGNVVNNNTENRVIPNAIAVWLKKNNKNGDNMNKKKVFIGVGHGGSDCGAIGNNLRESDINLSVALACRDCLLNHGVQVEMSRINDEDDKVDEEIAECNKFKPDLAVDIHTNSGGGDGFEIFHTIHGGVGKLLAENINKEIIGIGQNSRGVKTRKSDKTGKDYYSFIRKTSCPAVICEIGFIDNKGDLKDFDEKAEQIKFGKAYAHGILKTLGVEIMKDENIREEHEETKHWAYKHYKSLKNKGIEINEMRFDDRIKRGEVFALLDRIVK